MKLSFFSRSCCIVFLLLCMHAVVQAQDYRKIFNNDYDDGIALMDKYSGLFEATGTRFNINASYLRAIVFPEFIRYNTVYDFMEITSLKVLYITNGHDYANFSVGYLQMKPSFAEQLEKDAITYLDPAVLSMLDFNIPGAIGNTQQQRRERVNRLTKIDGQLQYLALFYKICEAKFRLAEMNEEKKIRFLAACYNAGYEHSLRQISKFASMNLFFTGRFMPSRKYCYSDISLYWFRSNAALQASSRVIN